jgi:DNA-binding NarL/FixJ family response regulator
MTVVHCPYRASVCHPAAETPDFDCLTNREKEVLLLLGGGLSNRILARQLDIAERTVKAHISRIQEKLGVQSRLEAALVSALNHGQLCGSDECR